MKSSKSLFLVAIIIFILLPLLGGCAAPLIGLVQTGLATGVTSLATETAKNAVHDNGGIENTLRKMGDGLGSAWSSLKENFSSNNEEREPASRVVQGLTPPAEFFVKVLPRKRKVRFAGKDHHIWSEGDPPLPSSKKTGVVAPVKKIPWGKGTAI